MQILEKTVYSTMKGTLLRRPRMEKLHLFPDEVIYFIIINSR